MENREKAYQQALEEAQGEFITRDPAIMAKASATKYLEEDSFIIVPLMERNYQIHYPTALMKRDDGKEVPLPYQILLLHYLTMSRGLPMTNKLISFKEIPGGLVYYDAFYRRAVEPLVKVFGYQGENFRKVGKSLGGEEVNLGDIAFLWYVLPRVPITYILWVGDREHPARASILFDKVVKNFLPMEDLALLASLPVWALMKAK